MFQDMFYERVTLPLSKKQLLSSLEIQHKINILIDDLTLTKRTENPI